jgi:hypothetical protein
MKPEAQRPKIKAAPVHGGRKRILKMRNILLAAFRASPLPGAVFFSTGYFRHGLGQEFYLWDAGTLPKSSFTEGCRFAHTLIA